jgi:multisubunit Na+/H+ antiporter MnhB subunit
MKVSRFYIGNALPAANSQNVVASIIVDFRAYDTMGEVAILFTAIVGVLAIARGTGRSKEDQ